MKIVVLNGSPKGEISVTMQYIKYIQKKFPQHQMQIINVCQTIKVLERDERKFSEVIASVKNADGVIWAFPVVYFLVHSNYKRFIELIWERGVQKAFENKYTAVLSSSIHIFDNVAHDYMHAISDDLKMNYTGFFSVSMNDLKDKVLRDRLFVFASDFFEETADRIPTGRAYEPVAYQPVEYVPGKIASKIVSDCKRILIISDCPDEDSNLSKMTRRFQQLFTGTVERIDINSMNIKGGCLGCVNCSFDNECVYGDNDDIRKVYNEKIREADIVVYCNRIVDRYFSSRWKLFYDRRFLNTHQPQMMNKQVGYIVSGPLGMLPSLRETICFQTETDHGNLAGVITDENKTSEEIDLLMDDFAKRIVTYAQKCYTAPSTFFGEGAGRSCRDLVWGEWRFIFQGDYRFYKKHGMHDFPHKNIGMRFMNLILSILCKIPSFKKKIQNNAAKLNVRELKELSKKMYENV